MSELEASEILVMVRRAELRGAWAALNWLGREWCKNMTVEDVAEMIHYGSIILEEQLAEVYKGDFCITLTMEEVVKRRLKEKAKVKST